MDVEAILTGCRVVVTRPAEQAEALAGPLRRLGAGVRVRPLIRIAPPADPAPLARVLTRLDEYDWIAFTSGNAVRACVAAAPRGARWPRVAAVGPGTARAADAAGLTPELVPEQFSAASLAKALLSRGGMAGGRVLWPRASGASEALGAGLRAAGVGVDEVECYRTLPDAGAAAALHQELAREPADVLVFTSPSAVRVFAEVAAAPPRAAVAVIGTVSAAAAVAAGWPVGVLPAEQSVPGLIAALREWWSARQAG